MESVLTCGAHGWPIIAGAVLTFGVLALGGAALIKYLFTGRPNATTAAAT